MLRLTGALAILSITSWSCVAAEERTPAIIGYLPDYRIDTINPAVGKLATDVIFFSLEPTNEGGLSPERLTEKQKQVLGEIRKQGARLHFSLGGWGRSDAFATIAADEKLREKFTAAISRFAEEGEFAGVDVDWEFPRGEKQIADFARLIHDLKLTLAAKGRMLSVAVACSQPLPQSIVDDVDRIHLMAYDAGKLHSTYELAEIEVDKALARGIPTSKLCLGVPFYGRMTGSQRGSKTYSELVRAHHPSPDVDEVETFYFNGIHTIQKKSRLALDRKLGGIMIWELGQDSTDETSLLRSIRAVINQ
jgi:GH18 family chitinase